MIALAVDLIAIALLAYATYFRRYYRRNLLLSYVALNVGVFAVSALLAGAAHCPVFPSPSHRERS